MKETTRKYNIPYTQVVNSVLTDPELSLRAKGLYGYLFSKPDGWEFHINAIAKELKESIKIIRATIKELVEAGYIIREQVNENGKFGGMIYCFNEDRVTKTPCAQNSVYAKKVTHNKKDYVTKKDLGIIEKENKEKEISFGDYEFLRPQIEKWLAYKKEKKQSYKSKIGILAFAKQLNEYSSGDPLLADKIIERSIANNYSGIFALKEKIQKQGKRNGIFTDEPVILPNPTGYKYF